MDGVNNDWNKLCYPDSKNGPEKAICTYINEDGMVACNPRDKEAAHRADVEGIGTEDKSAGTALSISGLRYQAGRSHLWKRRAKTRAKKKRPEGRSGHYEERN